MTSRFNSFGGLGETPTQEESTLETPAPKKRVGKVWNLSLDELYDAVAKAGKATPSFKAAIIAKEDLTTIQKNYCNAVCGLCPSSRRPGQARLQTGQADIVVLQDHNALPDKFKTSEQVEQITRDIIGFLAAKYFQGLKFSILNVVKCVPTLSDLRGAAITVSKAKGCSAYLYEELRQIQPKVVISLATNSNKILGLNLSSSTARGEFHKTEFGTVIVTLHPKSLTMIRQNASGKSWGPDYLEVIDRDFKKAAQIARGDFAVISLDEALLRASNLITICKSIEEVEKALDIINGFPIDKIVSFDLETTSLDPWAQEAKILTAQFGYTDPADGVIKAIVIPLWHRENHWFNPDEAWPFVAKILLSKRPKVGHNIKFDIIYTAVTTGVRVVNAALDTLLLLHAINSGLKGNYSLKKGVWDFLPETGLGGYEDKLPALTRRKNSEAEDVSEEEQDASSELVSD